MSDVAFPVDPRAGVLPGQVSAFKLLSYVANAFKEGSRRVSQFPSPGTSWSLTAAALHSFRQLLSFLKHLLSRASQLAASPLKGLSLKSGVFLFLGAYFLLRKLAAYDSDKKKQDNSGTKVAIVGGGIAGLGAAWALHRSGFNVTVFEKKPTLGGNAKAHNWIVPKDDGSPAIVRTGLSVLAWPRAFFNNYNMLMDELQIETVDHDLRFCVGVKPTKRSPPELVYVHGRESHKLHNLRKGKLAWLATDLARWNRVVRFVRFVNGVFSPMVGGAKSLYRVNKLNPLNLIPLTWVTKLFGVSDKFWNEVFVPIHTSTFLEADMNGLPALMAEVLEDIVPLSDPDIAPTMATWKAGHGDAVFERMTKGFKDRVHTSDEVEAVRFVTRPDGQGGFKKMAQVTSHV